MHNIDHLVLAPPGDLLRAVCGRGGGEGVGEQRKAGECAGDQEAGEREGGHLLYKLHGDSMRPRLLDLFCGAGGLHRNTISQIENGNLDIRLETLGRVIEALGFTMEIKLHSKERNE